MISNAPAVSGPAVAVLVDATVVRMVPVPAVMHLLGGANWRLPPVEGAGSAPPRRRCARGGRPAPVYPQPASLEAAE